MRLKANVLMIALGTIASCKAYSEKTSISDFIESINGKCNGELSFDCITARSIEWLGAVANKSELKITNGLSVIRMNSAELPNHWANGAPWIVRFLDIVNGFLGSHSLQVKLPKYLKNSNARSFISKWVTSTNVNGDLVVPLLSREINNFEGRGFIRKVVIPFLMGLKFKTSVMVPFALALIALKTWKAMTFSLLSIVVSAAIVTFKLIKPNVINYEVVQYAHAGHTVDNTSNDRHHIHPLPPYHSADNYIHENVDHNFENLNEIGTSQASVR